jgi:hypothetical protein
MQNQRSFLALSDSMESSLKAVRRRAQSVRSMPAEPEGVLARPASSIAALRSSSPGLCRQPLTAAATPDVLPPRKRSPAAGVGGQGQGAASAVNPKHASARAFSPIPGMPPGSGGLLLSARAIDDNELSLFHRRVRETGRRSKSVPPAYRWQSPLQVRAVDLSRHGSSATGSAALMSTR